MDCSPSGQFDETGCFVYELLEHMQLRKYPSSQQAHRIEHLQCEKGDLLAADLIRYARSVTSTTGPYVRLADCSGWLFEQKDKKQMMKRLPVAVGFWTFCADNYPSGVALRRHPMDRNDVRLNTMFLPMQKIYCDRKVTNDAGVNFYRVQGTSGWVFDKRVDSDQPMMLPEAKVQTGLFAYQAIETRSLAVRNRTSTDMDCRTPIGIKTGEIVVADCVRESQNGEGPFIRLTDGSGWLFEHDKEKRKVLERVKIRADRWRFRVENSIALRKQPIASVEFEMDTTLVQGDEIVCDRKIESPIGKNWYRVERTNGWIYDKLAGNIYVISEMDEPVEAELPQANGWSADFVRGIAFAADGMEEVAFNASRRLLSFRKHNSHVLLHVYCSTRSVITVIEGQEGKKRLIRKYCTDKELAVIMKNPVGQQGKKGGKERSSEAAGIDVDPEEELRLNLLEQSIEIDCLKKCQVSLMQAIKIYDDRRVNLAKEMEYKRMAHLVWLKESGLDSVPAAEK